MIFMDRPGLEAVNVEVLNVVNENKGRSRHLSVRSKMSCVCGCIVFTRMMSLYTPIYSVTAHAQIIMNNLAHSSTLPPVSITPVL